MKSHIQLRIRIAAAIALVSLAATTALPVLQAVPNSFGGTPFINPANMRLEDFANRAVMWQPNAELKGEWELWRDESIEDSTIEVMRLGNTATVFGVKASEVTLQRRNTRPLLFDVKFSTADESSFGKTRDQLIANINSWSGGSISADRPKIDVENMSVEISTAAEDTVSIRFAAPGSTGS